MYTGSECVLSKMRLDAWACNGCSSAVLQRLVGRNVVVRVSFSLNERSHTSFSMSQRNMQTVAGHLKYGDTRSFQLHIYAMSLYVVTVAAKHNSLHYRQIHSGDVHWAKP